MIGLGIMGSAMSFNLGRAGVRVVGYDVAKARSRGHKRAGGVAAKSPREVAKRADIVITVLLGARPRRSRRRARQVRPRGTVVVETSTLRSK